MVLLVTGLYHWLCHICFHQFYFEFPILFHDYHLCTTLLASWLVHSWFIQILGYRIIPDDSYSSILTVIVDNSGCAYSVDGDTRYMIYKWGFLCLELEVSISWTYLLSPYNWFCHIFLSHHIDVWFMFGCMLPSQLSIHALLIRILSIHVCLSLHATWHSPHYSLGSSDFPRSSCPGLGAWSL